MKTPAQKLLATIGACVCGLLALSCAGAAPPAVTILPPLNSTFIAASRVAAGPQSQLFVSDSASGSVTVLDASGRELVTKSGLGQPLGLAVDADGTIYLGDAATGSVSIYTAQWSLVGQLGKGAGEFLLPGYIALSTSNATTTVFVSDCLAHAVKAYRPARSGGALVGVFGSLGMGPAQFDFPAGLCIGPDQNLYVVDQNNDRIQVLSQNGTFLRWFGLQSSEGQMGNSGRSQGIAADVSGRLYVADAFQGRIGIYNTTGMFLGWLSGYGQDTGQLRLPGGITMDGAGRLWVADTGNARLQGFGIDCFVSLSVTPSQNLLAAGGTVALSATTGCSDGATYQWFKDSIPLTDGGIVSGASNAVLQLTGVTTGWAGHYSVKVAALAHTVSSDEIELKVAGPPVITASPASRSVTVGSTVSLGVSASGSGLGYQWRYNGLDIPGAVQSTLSLTNLQLLSSGKYWAVVTNVAGSVTSAQATLTVMTPPALATQPTNLTVAERGTAVFRITANGSTPLTYQWYKGTSVLAGQTTNSLTLTNVSPVAGGSYSVKVSNAAANTNSLAAALTVNRDTIPPVPLIAAGGAATNNTILVTFSEPLNVASAQTAANYQLVGPPVTPWVATATLSNATTVLLRLSGSRSPSADYCLRIQNIQDTALTPNLMSPNPTMLSVLVTDSLGSVAFWPLSEGSGTLARDVTGSGFDGTLESASWANGRNGYGVSLDGSVGDVVFPALNLNTNAVTITTWLKRSGTQPSSAGIVFTRAGSSVAGLRFGTTNDLRYNWNDVAVDYNFSSRLVPPDGVWTFAALVISPTAAVIYMNSGSGFFSATNITPHVLEEFNGLGYFGYDTGFWTRRYKGVLDEVRICKGALGLPDLQALYTSMTQPAACALASPVNGSLLTSPNIPLSATVAANGNSIAKVEFLSGASIVGVSRTAPFACIWNNPVSGVYSVKARAYYGPANYTVDSPSISFTLAIPCVANMQVTGSNLTLTWSGGTPPYQVQTANSLNSGWTNLGAPTSTTTMTLPPNQTAAFYRILSQ